VTALAAVGGATAVLGLILIVIGLAGVPMAAPASVPVPVRRVAHPGRSGSRFRRRAALLVVSPLVALLLTGWPVAALVAAAGALWLPRMLAGRRAAQARIARLEALADWTRRLSDVLTAGAGIEQAVEASLPAAPPPIGREVSLLVARLRARRPTEEALRAFGDELDDPTADLVVAALILAAHRRGRGLARLLTDLAATVEEEVVMRRGVEADRAQPRTTARWVTYITIGVSSALVVFDRAYVAPFGTTTGQLVLAAIACLFAAAFVWMYRLTAVTPGHRFLPPSGRAQSPTEPRRTGAMP
jgi:Flp pilus assembly protein TadB